MLSDEITIYGSGGAPIDPIVESNRVGLKHDDRYALYGANLDRVALVDAELCSDKLILVFEPVADAGRMQIVHASVVSSPSGAVPGGMTWQAYNDILEVTFVVPSATGDEHTWELNYEGILPPVKLTVKIKRR